MKIITINYKAIKTSKLLTASLLVLGILISGNISAQSFAHDATQVVRNTSPVTYTISNTEGVNATYTWTVTGGIIVESGTTTYSPVASAAATLSIKVTWDNTNKTAANAGTIKVTKTIGGCPGTEFNLNVNSWVAPSASVTTSPFTVCSATASTVDLAFQGNAGAAGYQYRWRVVRVSDNFVEQNHTTTATSSATATATVNIAAITNATAAPVQYRFEITQMQDAFDDMDGIKTAGTVLFTVNPVPTIGTINSSASLSLRP